VSKYNLIAIIYNPKSTGKAFFNSRKLADYIKAEIKNQKIKLISTEYSGHAEELAYKLTKKYSNDLLLISSSGDGGYNELINGAMHASKEGASSPICAVLPSGNANDHYADTRRVSLETAIIKKNVQKIDLMEVSIFNTSGKKETCRYAHSYLGLGLTPAVAIELNRHDLNALKEAYIVFKSFWRYRPFKIKVENKTLRLDSLIVSHIGRMAKILNFKRSQLDDGVFEVTIFAHGHRFRLLTRLLKAAISGLKPDYSCSEFKFETIKPIPMQLDGEVIFLKNGKTVLIKNSQRMLRTLL
jgi:diacylglycerol kinase family enzyme